MRVRVLLFAALRERVGREALEVDAPEGSTVEQVVQLAKDSWPGLVQRPFATAINRRYARPGEVIQAGDELALIPPVSGG